MPRDLGWDLDDEERAAVEHGDILRSVESPCPATGDTATTSLCLADSPVGQAALELREFFSAERLRPVNPESIFAPATRSGRISCSICFFFFFFVFFCFFFVFFGFPTPRLILAAYWEAWPLPADEDDLRSAHKAASRRNHQPPQWADKWISNSSTGTSLTRCGHFRRLSNRNYSSGIARLRFKLR